MPAPASASDFILEKFDLSFTFWALDLKDIFGLPESQILSWASHLGLLPEIASRIEPSVNSFNDALFPTEFH
jgi:hypothetical protein